MDVANPLSKSIEEMPEQFVIKSFLKTNKSEVFTMLLTEYNEAEVMGLFKKDGIVEGSSVHLIKQICKKLDKGKTIETIASEVEEDVATIKPICEVIAKHAPNYDFEAIYYELVDKGIME